MGSPSSLELHTTMIAGRPRKYTSTKYQWLAFGLATVIFLTLTHTRRATFLSYLSPSSLLSEPTTEPEPTEARYLSPQDLSARPLAVDITTIPKYFHQSWHGLTPPREYLEWSRTCRKSHPDWEWVLWTEEDNLALFQKYLPWFSETYEELPAAYQADVARNAYMLVFGGVYADPDIECLAPTETLILRYGHEGRQAFVGHMGTDNGPGAPNGVSVQNKWLASTPGHPFWTLPLEYAQNKLATHNGPYRFSLDKLTGPAALTEAFNEYYEKYSQDDTAPHMHYSGIGRRLFPQGHAFREKPIPSHNVTILPWWEIYPYSKVPEGRPKDACWAHSENFDETLCKELLSTNERGSHAITYWYEPLGEYGRANEEAGDEADA